MVPALLAAIIGSKMRNPDPPPTPATVVPRISAQAAVEAILSKKLSFPLIVAPQYPLGPDLHTIVYRAEALADALVSVSAASPIAGVQIFQRLSDTEAVFECLLDTA